MITEQEVRDKFKAMGIQILNCKDCNREIFFLKTKSGRSMPVTLSLESHFIDCPASGKFRRREKYNRHNKI